MWNKGKQNDPSSSQIRRNFDLLAIPRRTRAHSLDSVDSLDTIESHRQHRLNYLEKRAKFEHMKNDPPVSPTSETPNWHRSTLSTIVNSSSISSTQKPSDSAADTLGEMLDRITSQLNLLQQEDAISTAASKEPITRATVVERYIPAQMPMRVAVVSARGEPSTANCSKNRVSFDGVLPDMTTRKAAVRSSSFQFQRPSNFLHQSPGNPVTARRDPRVVPDFHIPQTPRNQLPASVNLGRHSYSTAQNLHTLPHVHRQFSNPPGTSGQDFHTPRPIRRHVSFSSVPLGDMPRRSTTSSIPVKTLIKKFSIDE